jgi:hypothetical protein
MQKNILHNHKKESTFARALVLDTTFGVWLEIKREYRENR